MTQGKEFKGRQFTAEVILWAVRWYLMFPISYRDLELMLQDRGVAVDHTTIFRWIQAYAPELDKRIRPHLRACNGSWRVDETYVKVKGRWTYLYRAVDSRGQTIDFLLSAKRDAAAAKCFFRKALGQPHTVNPRTLTIDNNAAYPAAVTAMMRGRQSQRSITNFNERFSHQSCAQARVGLRAPSRALGSRLLPALGAKADHEASRRAAVSHAKGQPCLRTLHS